MAGIFRMLRKAWIACWIYSRKLVLLSKCWAYCCCWCNCCTCWWRDYSVIYDICSYGARYNTVDFNDSRGSCCCFSCYFSSIAFVMGLLLEYRRFLEKWMRFMKICSSYIQYVLWWLVVLYLFLNLLFNITDKPILKVM